jgi:hypothetical protein
VLTRAAPVYICSSESCRPRLRINERYRLRHCIHEFNSPRSRCAAGLWLNRTRCGTFRQRNFLSCLRENCWSNDRVSEAVRRRSNCSIISSGNRPSRKRFRFPQTWADGPTPCDLQTKPEKVVVHRKVKNTSEPMKNSQDPQTSRNSASGCCRFFWKQRPNLSRRSARPITCDPDIHHR